MIVRNPSFLLLFLLLPLFALIWRRRWGRVPGLGVALRLVMVALVILALTDPILARPTASAGTLVLLVDQSDSLGDEGRLALRTQAAALADHAPGAAVHMIFFGANTVAPGVPVASAVPEGLRADGSDLAAALRMARGLIGPGGGRVALLSDGGQTRGDALAEAQALARSNVPVDTLAYTRPQASEIWVASVEAPQTLREGEEYQISVVVGSRTALMAELRLFEGATQLVAESVSLNAGENRLTYRSQAGQPGIVQLRATISGTPDGFERNNSAATTALIAPPPKVLLVEGRGGGSAPLRVGLRDTGIETDVAQAADLPSQLSELDAYEGIVLIDVPATDLSLDQMTSLREFVRSEGHGLVATGGRSSFTLGDYKDTPLEEALPVEMTPPPRPQRADVTMLLIIDRSASMGPAEGATRFNMAKESAILATQSLQEGDRLGVLAFDTDEAWIVPFQQIGTGLSIAQIQEQISAIQLGGGTDIYSALRTGLGELETQPGEVRHAVLLTDGKSFSTSRAPYQSLIESARVQNITLSSIAIGSDADTALLQDIAEWGAGRYHFADQPEDIPRLTLLESEIASTEPQIEGTFRADLAAPHPLLREFAPNQLPQLGGYVATTLKPDAELVLESPEHDPVLAAWQYGLGRAVAWTPSVEEPWARSWSNWPEYGQFWADIIGYTLPEPDSGLLQIRVTPSGDAVMISADSLLPGGAALDLADTEATITLPDGNTSQLVLRQTGPGRYAESVTLPADGPYTIDIQQRKDSSRREAKIGYVQPYPAEYLPVLDGAQLLEQISAATGGQQLSEVNRRTGAASQAASEATPLATWLLLGAALLWPIEIAVRRGWLRWGR